MSKRRNHPSALDVSFVGPDALSSFSDNIQSKKRKSEAEFEPGSNKRPFGNDQSSSYDTVQMFRPDQTAHDETSGTVIPGEIIDNDEDSDSKKDTKPIRFLDDFHFFDPKHSYEAVDLSSLAESGGVGRHCEGIGNVTAVLEDEYVGQDDDAGYTPVLLRLSSILRYTFEYKKQNDPVYVETIYGWYRLGIPSKTYSQVYRRFYISHRAAQLVIATLIADKLASFDDLLDGSSYLDRVVLGRNFDAKDFVDAYPIILRVLEGSEHRRLLSSPLAKEIAEDKLSPAAFTGTRRADGTRNIRRRTTSWEESTLNLDREVLKVSNQSQTAVTTLLDCLSTGLYCDSPYVLDYKSGAEEKVFPKEDEARRSFLVQLFQSYREGPLEVTIERDDWLKENSQYARQARVSGVSFKVGDVAIVPRDDLELKVQEIFSEEDLSGNVADYFWFAIILSINRETQKAHLRWFEHSSQTWMQELYNPRELFITPLCDDWPLNEFFGKAAVRQLKKEKFPSPSDALEYFYKFQYVDGQFVDVPDTSSTDKHPPPDNCPNCALAGQHDFDSHPQSIINGYAYRGDKYHPYDFINFIAVEGPCRAGQILRFESEGRQSYALVNLLGYVDRVKENRPQDCIKDERHLFMTEDVARIPIADFIRKIYVVLPSRVSNLHNWKSMSPAHFFVRYKFSSITAISWDDPDFKVLEAKDIPCCSHCFEENRKELIEVAEFSAASKLKALDLFAGVGAFGFGMEFSCPIKVTHAIEISPSAARTLSKNSTGIIVYNQCSNEMLKYAIDSYNGIKNDVPRSILSGQPVPAPPQPGDIDVIIAAFPCQSHSSLNMYQQANDRKSLLILNLLSWVEFLQPRFCFFENVRGFLRYNLRAVQVGKHRLEGGISMGGLKIIARALIAMDYQVKIALLQAGHYGVPQSRVRFYMIAAKRGEIIPDFPQPTHDFPVVDALKIKFPNHLDIEPIQSSRGTAPGHFVTIDDAIGDLPQFDWKGTRQSRGQNQDDEYRNVPAFACDRSKGWCGLDGVVPYRSEPTTMFQLWCRKKDTTNLQHYTRTLKEAVVNRVVNIPLEPRADYRSLPRDLWEWQISHPSSAVARGGFKAGIYGRLDKNEWFRTIVTNVEPTAKQSWVLHPECKRVLSVRELARSQGFPDNFVFYSIYDDVKAMHRQIGNAIPWQVSIAIGREFRKGLYKRWLKDRAGREDMIWKS